MSGVTRGFRFLQYLRQIQGHGGKYYVQNCQPGNIPAACERLDCPMRSLSLPPEAEAGAALLACEPVGSMADILISLRRTQED